MTYFINNIIIFFFFFNFLFFRYHEFGNPNGCKTDAANWKMGLGKEKNLLVEQTPCGCCCCFVVLLFVVVVVVVVLVVDANSRP